MAFSVRGLTRGVMGGITAYRRGAMQGGEQARQQAQQEAAMARQRKQDELAALYQQMEASLAERRQKAQESQFEAEAPMREAQAEYYRAGATLRGAEATRTGRQARGFASMSLPQLTQLRNSLTSQEDENGMPQNPEMLAEVDRIIGQRIGTRPRVTERRQRPGEAQMGPPAPAPGSVAPGPSRQSLRARLGLQ